MMMMSKRWREEEVIYNGGQPGGGRGNVGKITLGPFCLLRHQITCHLPPFLVYQDSATTVARVSKKQPV